MEHAASACHADAQIPVNCDRFEKMILHDQFTGILQVRVTAEKISDGAVRENDSNSCCRKIIFRRPDAKAEPVVASDVS